MERKFLGVCVWISKKIKIKVTWVRIGFVVATILGVGTPVLIYLAIYDLVGLRYFITFNLPAITQASAAAGR